MIGVKYLIALCVIGIVSAQDEVGSGSPPPAGRQCFVGQGDSYESLEGAKKDCEFLEKACQVKVEISKDGMKIFGECKELTTCQANEDGSNQCFNQLYTRAQSAEMEHMCHYCCQGALCNTASFIQDKVNADRALLYPRNE